MKVILSVDPIKYPLTGIGRYTYELACQLAVDTEVSSLKFLRGTRLIDSIPDVVSNEAAASSGLRRKLLKSQLAVSLYQLAMPRMKGLVLRGREDHVFHGPNFYLPPFKGRSVVTMHDLSSYLWSDCHPPERVRYMRSEIELSLRRASRLITDSEYIRQEVAGFWGWPLEKIHVAPLASAAEFHPRTQEQLAACRKKYDLPEHGYALFLGTIEPRKNIPALLDAYGSLPESVRARWPLILAGYKGWRSDDIHDRIERATRAGWARYLGFLSADELPLLMAGARLFVFPSLYEGFGLPVVEAMASGVPVVCSNASSLPEVAGWAALMCDASDTGALRELVARGLEDEAWRAAAVAEGLAQAAKFSWRRCAKETLAAYRAALND